MLLKLYINYYYVVNFQILSNSVQETYQGYDSILLLTLLMNVETAKKTNPYIVKLSLLDKENMLNGYSQVHSIYTI